MPRRARSASIGAVLLLVLCLWAPSASSGPGIVQTPLLLSGRSIGKLTQSYTLADPDIQGPVFSSVRAGGIFTVYEPNGDPRRTAIFVDPIWSRIIYATDGYPLQASDGYGYGPGKFAHPRSIDVSPIGKLFVADTDNKLVKMYAYSRVNDEYFFVEQFSLPGGSDFGKPEQVLWDDNGTPTSEGDDVFWVLDVENRRIAAYHVSNNGSAYVYSPYLSVGLDAIGTSHPTVPACIAKGRLAPTNVASSSYCTTKLYLYDRGTGQFFFYDVPRSTSFLGGAAAIPLITMTVVPNPYPGVDYDALSVDAWGNLLAVSSQTSQLFKLTPDLQPIGAMGRFGMGAIGTGEYAGPIGIALEKRRNPDGTTEILQTGIVTEQWGAQSGIQAFAAQLELSGLSVSHVPGAFGLSIAWSSSAVAQTTVRVRNAATNAILATPLSDAFRGAGQNQLAWDGRDGAGVLVPPCEAVLVEIEALEPIANATPKFVVQSHFYKPAIRNNLTVSSSIGGATAKYDGVDVALTAAGVALPCSLCTSHALTVAPAQTLAGVRYCFDRWSDNGSRNRSISLTQDTNLTLYLTSGPGPTILPAGGTIVNEACDCKSPYIFQGNASLTKNADWDSFRTQGPVVFRFPHGTGSQTRARLGIGVPAVLSRATFETVDSSSTQTSNLWEGITVTSGGSLDCDSCRITNANVGISAPLTSPARSLRLRNSYLDYNFTNDINVAVDTVGARPVSIYKNRFNGANAVKLTVAGSVIAPHASAVIDSNAFASPAGPSGALNVVGGWSGYISRNQFYIPVHNTVGVQLDRYSNFGWPVFELHQNQFIMEGNYGRFALVAPKSDPFTMNAESNDWGGAYNVAFNDLVIKDYNDDTQRALVDYDPFIIPAGGGGGGCPFVLSQGEAGYEVENSILGRSESASAAGATVRDAVVLSHVKWTKEPIRLRIAELESDVDEIDYGALGVVAVGEGEEVGVDTEGLPVVFRRGTAAVNPTRWSGRSQPFVSPIAPVNAYRGEPGDSLELRLDPAPGAVVVRDTRIAVSMVPKPQEARSKPGGLAGVTVRVSYDSDGEKWTSIPAVFPREAWTTQVLPLGEADGRIPSRVRIVWNSRHTLGWVGPVESRPAELLHVSAPRMARHSSGHDVLGGLSREDGHSVRILPGEHLDLEFASPERDPNARLVLLVRGRYTRTGTGTPEVPAVAYLAQNGPNPFNPETEIRFGLPAAARTSLRVFSVSGRLMTTLVDGVLPGGTHIVRWDGRDSRGRQVSSGVYFYQIDAGDFHERRRMVLLR